MADKERATPDNGAPNWSLLADVRQTVSIILGEGQESFDNVSRWQEGSLLELDKVSGQPVDVMVNGKVCFRGEVVVVAENFGVRITEVVRDS